MHLAGTEARRPGLAGRLDWSDALGARYTTLLFEARYRPREDGFAEPLDGAAPAEVRGELAPWKAHAEILVLGARSVARVKGLSVARGATLLVWKTLAKGEECGTLVHPERDAAARGLSPSFGALPLDHPLRTRWLHGLPMPDLGECEPVFSPALDLRYFQRAACDLFLVDRGR